MKILDLIQGSSEWLAVRRQYVTASEMASVLKVPGAYKSRSMLMKHKLHGEPEPSAYTANLFARGHMAEAGLTKDAEEMLGMPFQSLVAVHEEHGILASFDNINLEHGVIVETKNCISEKKLELARDFKVWEPYRVQILTQMLVANVRIGFMLMRDENTDELHLVPVSPDEVTTKRIIEETAQFTKELSEARKAMTVTPEEMKA